MLVDRKKADVPSCIGPSGLGDHTGYLLRQVSNAVSHDFSQRMSKAGVTVAEWAVMRTLYDHDAMAPSVLAERMGLTKGAVSKLGDRLLAKRLIERTDNPEDRRGFSLSLSGRGRALVPELAMIADSNDGEFFGVLDPDEHEALVSLLRKVIERHALSGVAVD